jgi:hypothetical protein
MVALAAMVVALGVEGLSYECHLIEQTHRVQDDKLHLHNAPLLVCPAIVGPLDDLCTIRRRISRHIEDFAAMDVDQLVIASTQ